MGLSEVQIFLDCFQSPTAPLPCLGQSWSHIWCMVTYFQVSAPDVLICPFFKYCIAIEFEFLCSLFIQYIFIKNLLCARHCYSVNQKKKKIPVFVELFILAGKYLNSEYDREINYITFLELIGRI